jgi:hypothetical protein
MLVKEGLNKLQVLQGCGEPDYQDSHLEYRSIRLGSGYNQPGIDITRTVEVRIDEWTYDFGPRRFMQRLVFEEGRLVFIQDLGYGTANGTPP